MNSPKCRRLARQIRSLRKAQEAIQEGEERFRNAFEYAAIGKALVAPDGRWLRVNRSVCEITGYSEAELLARTFQDITHPDDLGADLDQVRRLLGGEIRYYHMEKRYFHKLGHVVWVMLSVSLVQDARSRPLYFVSQIQDISGQKAVQEALRESRERTRSVLDTAITAFVAVDETGIVVDCNPRAEQKFGWSRGELIGRPMAATILAARVREAFASGLSRYLQTNATADLTRRGETLALRRDGHEFPVEFNLSPLRWRGETVFNIFMQNITDRKRAEEERESLIVQLRDALATVKTLRGLLPVCAWCRQVRDDEGYWRHLETHLQEHLDVKITHGICPTCMSRA